MLVRPGRILALRTSRPCVMGMEAGPKDAWGNTVGINDAFFPAPPVQNRTQLAVAYASPSAVVDVSVREFARLIAERAPSPEVRDWRSKDIGRWVLTNEERDDGPREFRPLSALIMGKIVIDEFVLRKQPDTEIVRAGLGGGSPQAALAAQLWSSKVGLMAPVGQKFSEELLHGMSLAGVDTAGVTRLAGYVTPRTQIRYEADRTVWTPGEGWDRWEELKHEMLPMPEHFEGAPLVHMITEGSGGAETQMAFDYLARNPPAVLSIEPVMHDVSAGAVEALTPHSSAADLVCPDWETAVGVSNVAGCAALDVVGSEAHPHLMRRFEVVPGLTHGGRPVYCAEAIDSLPRGYLYHVQGCAGASRWYLGPTVGSDVACLFAASEAVTPDLVTGAWQEYHAGTREWRVAVNMDVVRAVGMVEVIDGDGARRSFAVEHGELTMRVHLPGSQLVAEHVIKHLHYATALGKVTDGDGEFSFILPASGRAEYAASLSGVCASAGVHWDEDGTKVRDWEQLDDSLHVAGAARQNIWRAVVDGESAEAYYWNVCTGETVWHRPAEMLRVSCSQETTRASVRSLKGDVSYFTSDADAGTPAAEHEPMPERDAKPPPCRAELARMEGEVLVKSAERLGMTRGVLAVRCGARGSIVLDCRDKSRYWRVPAVQVPVVDPLGAGNAFASAFAVGLADRSENLNREELVLQGACRASATAAAFVAADGMPVASAQLREWLRDEAHYLRARVEAVPISADAAPLPFLPIEYEPEPEVPIVEEAYVQRQPVWGAPEPVFHGRGGGSYLDSL